MITGEMLMRRLIVSSPANRHFKEAMNVGKRRPESRDIFLAEGVHLVEMALGADLQISRVFVSSRFMNEGHAVDLLNRLSDRAVYIIELADHLFSRLADTETPQGIIAEVRILQKPLHAVSVRAIPFIVVIDGVQDPGNLGSIIRTADAAGADAVIVLPGSCDPFMQKTVRSTAGSIFNLPVVSADAAGLISWFREKEILLAGTALSAKTDIYEVDLRRPVGLAFGNEAHGLGEEIMSAADMVLRLPMRGKAESLNVAAAAAVCLYEVLRQRMKS